MVDTLRTRILIVLGLILISTMVLGLTDVTNFLGLDIVQLDFQGAGDEEINVSLWDNSHAVNVRINLLGLLSDWITAQFYNTTITSPVNAQYITSSKWLISDTSWGIYLVNPQGGVYDSYSGTNMFDAEWITDDKWFYVDQNNGKVVLFDATTDTELDSYIGLTNPEAADYVSDTKWLIADTGADIVRLIENGIETRTYSNSIQQPVGASYIDDEEWLIVTKAAPLGKIIHANSTSNTLIKQYASLSSSVRSVDRVIVGTDEYWLIADSTMGVFLVNMTAGSDVFPNKVLASYTDTDAAYDARYISLDDWLITDKNGVKRVQEQKKYYPTDLNLTIDGAEVWSMNGALKTQIEINDTTFANALSNEINEYLQTCIPTNGNCTIPFVFHSTTPGVLNLSNLNISVDRKPTVVITAPTNNMNWSGNQTIQWTTTDDDNDTLTTNVYYWNTTGWELIYSAAQAAGAHSYFWITANVSVPNMNNASKIMVNVTDNYAPMVSAVSDVFTLDNTLPTVTVNYPNGGEFLGGVQTIFWNATDNIDNNLVISIEYSPDNGTTWELINASTINDGQETGDTTVGTDSDQAIVRINATDNAGNMQSDVSDDVFTLDNTAPIVNLMSPQGYQNSIPLNFTFNVTDNLITNLTCYLYTDESGVLQNVSEMNVTSGTTNFFTHPINDGFYNWNVNCSDGLNSDFALTNWSIDLDTQVLAPTFFPNVTITTTAETIQARFDEVVTLTYAMFDNQLINMTTVDNQTFTYNANNLGNGNRNLIINATDNHSNSDQFTNIYLVSIPSNNPGGRPGGGGSCIPSWSCTPWSICSEEGKQTRSCVDLRKCRKTYNKPAEEQTCMYVPIREMNFTTEETPGGENLIEEEEEGEEIEEGMESITGGLTGGFLDTTGGKVAAGILLILVIAALTVIVRNAVLKKKAKINIEPPKEQ